MDFSAHSIIWTILVGLVIGAIAKLLMPGKIPVVASSRFCSVSPVHWWELWLGRLFAGENYIAGCDHVGRRRHDPVAALSNALQTRRIGARAVKL